MTKLDKCILNRLQQDLPFIKRPWSVIAGELGVEERFLLKRIDFLKKKGIIRRISAVFNPAQLGFVSTLVAIKTAPARIKQVARKLNSYPEVTHNYQRGAEYNLWFTLVAKDSKRIARILAELKKDKDIEEILNLPAIKLFKIEVNFAL